MTNNTGNMLDRHPWVNALLTLIFIIGLYVASYAIIMN
jgi:hypothetical protein